MRQTSTSQIEAIYGEWSAAADEFMNKGGSLTAFAEKTCKVHLDLALQGVTFKRPDGTSEWIEGCSPDDLAKRIGKARVKTMGDKEELEKELLADGRVTTTLMSIGARQAGRGFEPGEFESVVIQRRGAQGIVATFG